MFSNLTHNALNALMLVAQHQSSGPVTTEFISRHLGLSISYLESLMSSLKKKEFLKYFTENHQSLTQYFQIHWTWDWLRF